jgi:pyruvate ferredoxin oxidoreductase gamma subunit
MFKVRIHGRGGQGNVVAAYLLATSAIEKGLYAQAFPAFGAERRGAPVIAFVRVSEKPVRRRDQVRSPDYLIIQDQALLHVPGVLDGLAEGGRILVNSPRSAEELEEEFGMPMTPLAATALAKEHLGRPVPNTALLAAFFTLSGTLPVDALVESLAGRFKGEVLEKNTRMIEAAAAQFEAGAWKKEVAHAASA